MKVTINLPHDKGLDDIPDLKHFLNSGNDGSHFDYEVLSDYYFVYTGIHAAVGLGDIQSIKHIRLWFKAGLKEARDAYQKVLATGTPIAPLQFLKVGITWAQALDTSRLAAEDGIIVEIVNAHPWTDLQKDIQNNNKLIDKCTVFDDYDNERNEWSTP